MFKCQDPREVKLNAMEMSKCCSELPRLTMPRSNALFCVFVFHVSVMVVVFGESMNVFLSILNVFYGAHGDSYVHSIL